MKAAWLIALLACAAPAWAQPRVEIGAGGSWTGGVDAGAANAELTRPAGATPGLTLFGTSAHVDAAAGLIAHAGVFLGSRVAIEGVVEYSRPVLRVTIADDFENAVGTEAVNTLASYLFGGSVLYHFRTGRLAPFALAGAGRLRELDEGAVTLVTGSEVHAGGGVKFRMSSHFGLRADAVMSSRDRSLAFEDKRRTRPVVSAGVFLRF